MRSSLERPGLSKVRQVIRDGETDTALFWHPAASSIRSVEVLLAAGSQSSGNEEPRHDRLGSVEVKTISLRVEASQDHLQKGGRLPGGIVPYGYRIATGLELEHDPSRRGNGRRKRLREMRAAERRGDQAPAGGQLGPTALQGLLRSSRVFGVKKREANSPGTSTRASRSCF